ncbi:MAG: hypothetical protein ABEK00_01475 [Candidatus Nanohaloarchaea archaeon]
MTDSFKVRLKALITYRSDIMLEDSRLPVVELEHGEEIEKALKEGLEPDVDVHQIITVENQEEALEILVHCESGDREKGDWASPEEVRETVDDEVLEKEESEKFLEKLEKAPF